MHAYEQERKCMIAVFSQCMVLTSADKEFLRRVKNAFWTNP